MSSNRLTRCGLCDSANLELVVSLGNSPPPCVMHPVGQPPLVEEYYPLELLRCRDCTLVQLSVVVDPEIVFAPEFPYSSGNSAALRENFADLARKSRQFVVSHALGGLRRDDLVVDVGANDGTLLANYEECRTVGVEPTQQAERIPGPAYQAFFDEALADQILDEHGPAKIITACNVLAHVDDLGMVMRGICKLLADDGVLIVENHDLAALAAGQWDMVYHEHLRYYSIHSFTNALERHGLYCNYWHGTPTHGGSVRMFASHRKGENWSVPDTHADALNGLQRKARQARALIRHVVGREPVWGIGATARGTTIINYCGLDVEDVECVCEVPQSDKIGHYIPGTSIPVVDEERLFTGHARPGLLLSWHMADIIVPKLRSRGYDQPIIVPLPELRYL